MNEQKDIQNVGTEGHVDHKKKRFRLYDTVFLALSATDHRMPDIPALDPTPYFRRFEKRRRK